MYVENISANQIRNAVVII